LEGTNLNSENSFAVLDDTDIIDKSDRMGVHIEHDNFSAINLIRDLELARHALKDKVDHHTPVIIEEVSLADMDNECSDVEDNVVITPKRIPKPIVRLSLSGLKKKGKNRAIPTIKKSAKEGGKESMAPPLGKKN